MDQRCKCERNETIRAQKESKKTNFAVHYRQGANILNIKVFKELIWGEGTKNPRKMDKIHEQAMHQKWPLHIHLQVQLHS